MLSNQLQNGVETAKLIWSRLANAEDGSDAEGDEDGVLRSEGFDAVESLDYEVIENYAYRQEQARRGKLYVWYNVGVK
ncbi:hypothetical protein HanRHA438_Chr07g0292751 [Helianthus annuus]|nr:chloride channel protein CLC-d-like [Helianthus annuus]KAF5797564.1 hypothetical protein HanXRQr2_Chr07g0282151 [Helianthus annuus]KAJ0730423.1 hypothetical protein HanOQP8_Chr07g0239831 [Helianthus annuus]KAJ0906916.1 hypothetical protein HanRHA438_Chr07g0292751 [Helianthus annuus]